MYAFDSTGRSRCHPCCTDPDEDIHCPDAGPERYVYTISLAVMERRRCGVGTEQKLRKLLGV
jgi:hypothetical protein